MIFFVSIWCVFAFSYYTTSFILVITIVFYQSNLFWDCPNGFANTFNDFNTTNNFIRFLNFTYSFGEFNVDVSYSENWNIKVPRNKLGVKELGVKE